MPDTVFYSWQSDLPNRSNRGLIQSALENATKAIRQDESIKINPVIDRDTWGVPGAPDISKEILRKIDSALAFVGDVSITSRPKNGRPTPNPNVLIELGYALKSLGSNNIIMLFNSEFGDINELPFDLRGKRVILYNTKDIETPAEVRKDLAKKFISAISAILSLDESQDYLRKLHELLIDIILFGEESRERSIKPWSSELINIFNMKSGELRDLSSDRVGAKHEAKAYVEKLAIEIDDVVDFPKALGRESWNNFNNLVDLAVNTAWECKRKYLDSSDYGRFSFEDAVEVLRNQLRKIKQWIDRFEQSERERRYTIFEKCINNIIESGLLLLRISYYQIEKFDSEFFEILRKYSRDLHLIDCHNALNGIDSKDEIINQTKNLIEPLLVTKYYRVD